MSSNPMTSSPITLDAFVAKAGELPHSSTYPCVIAIVGASGSGKSTIAHKLERKLHHATIFSQDLFQFGRDFANKKTSLYKWDDPDNFALDQGVSALQTLKKGQPVTVPAFDVVANERIGTKAIAPADYILWEGIYALGNHEMQQLVDLSLFIDTPFIVRLLRRISRFFTNRNVDETTDMSTPARQMLTFVWAAEKTFMGNQRNAAEYYIPFDNRTIKREIHHFIAVMTAHVPIALRQPHADPEKRSKVWNGLRFVLKESSFEVYSGFTCLYVAPIEVDLRQEVGKNFDEIIF